jgi:prevent-host-death family protein
VHGAPHAPVAARRCSANVVFVKTEPLTTLRRNAAELIGDLGQGGDSILITRHGRPAAYVVGVATYEGLNQKLAVLEAIARGERALKEGRTLAHAEARKPMPRWLT